jgi:hypothetical protein
MVGSLQSLHEMCAGVPSGSHCGCLRWLNPMRKLVPHETSTDEEIRFTASCMN